MSKNVNNDVSMNPPINYGAATPNTEFQDGKLTPQPTSPPILPNPPPPSPSLKAYFEVILFCFLCRIPVLTY